MSSVLGRGGLGCRFYAAGARQISVYNLTLLFAGKLQVCQKLATSMSWLPRGLYPCGKSQNHLEESHFQTKDVGEVREFSLISLGILKSTLLIRFDVSAQFNVGCARRHVRAQGH